MSESGVLNEEDTKPFLLNRRVSVKNDQNIENYYKLGDFLGSGKFGDVTKCTELKTNYELAAKIIPIHTVDDKDLVLNEVCIMNKLRHPRLIQLYDVYVNTDKITLVMELISGGELFERIIDESFDLSEAKCAKFMKEILQGVDYIHKQKIVHLDLKPENILCLTRTGFKIKIIDFGLAKEVDEEEIRVLFGTAEFVAPEVISYDPVSYASDMWSVGVICYVLLSGLSPFMGDNEAETLSNIVKCVYSFQYAEFKEISNEAKDFIKRLLVKNARKRYNSTQCLEHPWLSDKEKTNNCAIVNKKNLKHFVYRRKWQKAVNAIIALQRMGVCLTHKPEARKLLQKRSLITTQISRKTSLQTNFNENTRFAYTSEEMASSIRITKEIFATGSKPHYAEFPPFQNNPKKETNKSPLILKSDFRTEKTLSASLEFKKDNKAFNSPNSSSLDSKQTDDENEIKIIQKEFYVKSNSESESTSDAQLATNTHTFSEKKSNIDSNLTHLFPSISNVDSKVALKDDVADPVSAAQLMSVKSNPDRKPKSAALLLASLSKNPEGIANRIKFFSASKETENSNLSPKKQ